MRSRNKASCCKTHLIVEPVPKALKTLHKIDEKRRKKMRVKAIWTLAIKAKAVESAKEAKVKATMVSKNLSKKIVRRSLQ